MAGLAAQASNVGDEAEDMVLDIDQERRPAGGDGAGEDVWHAVESGTVHRLGRRASSQRERRAWGGRWRRALKGRSLLNEGEEPSGAGRYVCLSVSCLWL